MQTAELKGVEWYGDFGDFYYFGLTFDLTCELDDDDPDNMTLTCDINNLSTWDSPGTSAGYGFLNVAGCMWNETSEQFESRYNNPSTQGAETLDGIYYQLTETIPNFDTDNIFFAYATDDNPISSNGYREGSLHHVFTGLTNETIEDLMLISPWERWRDNSTDEAVVSSGGGFYVSFEQVFSSYFPGAVRIGGRWISQDDDGHGDYVRSGGVWREQKNRQNTGEHQTGYYRHAYTWNRLPLYE